MPIDITSRESTNARVDETGLGYFVGGQLYGAMFAIPFVNTDIGAIKLNKLVLPLGYRSDYGSPRTVRGAVWLASKGPIDGAKYNVMDLYTAATDNLSVLRNKNKGNVRKNEGYRYWYSPWFGLGANDFEKVKGAMYWSSNTATPTESIYHDSRERIGEHELIFDDNIEIPAGTLFYAGIFADREDSFGNSIAIRRLGYTSIDRNGGSGHKYYYDKGCLVACNYEGDYRGRWHFYHDFYEGSSTEHNNYAQGCVDAKVNVSSIYGKPWLKITNPADNFISRNDTNVNIFYSHNTTSNPGNTRVEFNVNNTGWKIFEGSSNDEGKISFKPADYGVPDGSTGYSVKVRRVSLSTNIDKYSDTEERTLKTFSKPVVLNLSKSPASEIVNGDTRTTIVWNPWVGNNGEHSECYVSIVNVDDTDVSNVTTLGHGINVLSFYAREYVNFIYDNQLLWIKVVRKNLASGELSAPAYLRYTTRFKPTSIIQSLTSKPGIIKENTRILWKYPSGYEGIVSGYHVELYNEGLVTVSYDVGTNECTVNVEDLKPAKWYNIKITPYYLHYEDSKKYYGIPYTEKNYLYFDKGLETPVILYPKDGFAWAGNTYRVIFRLPKDYNYNFITPEEQSAYRYRDIDVQINKKSYKFSEYPQAYSIKELRHEEHVVFNPVTIGIPSDEINTIRVRVLSHFNNQSDYSLPVMLSNYKLTVFNKSSGDPILYNDYKNVYDCVINMFLAYAYANPHLVSKFSIISDGDINKLVKYMKDLIQWVNTNFSYANDKAKFKTIDDIAFTEITKNSLAYAIPINTLIDMIKKMLS